MGKIAIIAVLTLLFALSIIGYNLNRRATDAVSNYVGYYCHTQAHDIAASSAEIYIRKLAEPSPPGAGEYTINSIIGGAATVTLTNLSGDTLNMVSVGRYNGFSDTVKNKLYPVLANIPQILAAVAMSSNDTSKVTLNGGSGNGNAGYFSGYDTNPPGEAGNWPAVSDTVAGLALNMTSPAGNVTIKVPSNVIGRKIAPDTERVATLPDYTSFANQMIRLANKVYNNTSLNNTTLGTDVNPQVTCFVGSTMLGAGVSGSGILIINGDLTMSGTFTFNGLVIVYGSGNISVTSNGQANIYGALVLAGNNTSFTLDGGGNSGGIYYSSNAITNVRNKTGPLKYLISDWWE